MCTFLIGNSEGNQKPLGPSRRRWDENVRKYTGHCFVCQLSAATSCPIAAHCRPTSRVGKEVAGSDKRQLSDRIRTLLLLVSDVFGTTRRTVSPTTGNYAIHAEYRLLDSSTLIMKAVDSSETSHISNRPYCVTCQTTAIFGN